jgi:diaminopimelate epimerase
MRLPFTKMHGLGNDFVVLDAVTRRVELTPAQIQWIARRRFGVGCDQVLVLQTAERSGVDFYFRIFNADGSEAEQCGNGARCLARFLHDRGLIDKTQIKLQSLGGVISLRLEADGRVTADMGVPVFEPVRVPFEAKTQQVVYDLDIGARQVQVSVLSLGNPHAVQVVDELSDAVVSSQGPLIERHVRFPRRVNAGFMQVLDRRQVRLRVHERGVGETLACGSGACAAVVAGRQRGLLDDAVEVVLPGGSLSVAWAGEDEGVFMTGPTVSAYEGIIDLEAI